MIFRELGLDGLFLIDLERREDERGFFSRLFCADEFQQHGLDHEWAQINNSLSVVKGTLRGLHFQRPPAAEVKLIRCVRGSILDVAVDLRQGSPTYGEWRAAELTAQNRSMLYIPRGFGHGFQTLKDDSEIIYLNSTPYSPEKEGGLRYDDADVGIDWPLEPACMSGRDQALPGLKDLPPITLPKA